MIAPLGVLRDRDCQPGVAVHFWSVSLVTLARSLCLPRALEIQIVQHTAARIFAPGLIRLPRFCIAAFLYSSKPRLKSCMSLGFGESDRDCSSMSLGLSLCDTAFHEFSRPFCSLRGSPAQVLSFWNSLSRHDVPQVDFFVATLG